MTRVYNQELEEAFEKEKRGKTGKAKNEGHENDDEEES